MDKISDHNIIRFEYTPEYTFDVDAQTAEKLRINFNNEITAIHIIQSGDLKRLDEFLANSDSDIILGYSNTPFGNERAFAERILALSSIAAVNGGVDCTVTYSLIYKFQNVIESTNDSKKLIELTYSILREFCKVVAFQYYKKCKSPVLLPALRYIHSNLNKRITVAETASKLNMNADYLSQLFKKEIGEAFSSYVLRTKISFAKHLLETTEKSISEISEYLAFSSQSHFTNTFIKYEGVTPKQYRYKVKSY